MNFNHYAPKNWNPSSEQEAYIMTNQSDFEYALLELMEMKPADRPSMAIIDTVDGLISSIARSICQEYKAKTINDDKLSYGKGQALVKQELQDIMIKFQQLNVGLIFISHLEEKTIYSLGKETQTVTRSTIPPYAKTIINGLVDFIWYFTQEGKRRFIKTEGDMSIEAGSRISIPDKIPMGKTPAEAYANILTAFHGRTGKKGKDELITRILKGETHLADKKIDNFDTEKRNINSRKKHLNTEDLNKADIVKLDEYYNHLIAKTKTKEK